MEKQYYINAVNSLAKDKYSSCSESGTVVWKDGASNLPSEAEIQTEIIRLKSVFDKLEYSRNREAEYPSYASQLDLQYWDVVNGTTKWKDTIANVKADNPKE
jgi:hypothetical protein|tara:strand:- start:73 stop:378 length:306 start_codon:yes stop_codon:yes gene_type:complete